MSSERSPLQSGTFLLRQISEKRITAEQLTQHQRVLCIQYMLHEAKWTQMEIAEIVGVHRTTVARTAIRLREHAAMALDVIDQRSVALDLIQHAEVVCAHLMREGKKRDAWAVKKELVESLQTLGFISKEPIRFEGNIKLSLREVIELAHGSGKAADIAAENSGIEELPERIQEDPNKNGSGFNSNGAHSSVEGTIEP